MIAIRLIFALLTRFSLMSALCQEWTFKYVQDEYFSLRHFTRVSVLAVGRIRVKLLGSDAFHYQLCSVLLPKNVWGTLGYVFRGNDAGHSSLSIPSIFFPSALTAGMHTIINNSLIKPPHIAFLHHNDHQLVSLFSSAGLRPVEVVVNDRSPAVLAMRSQTE